LAPDLAYISPSHLPPQRLSPQKGKQVRLTAADGKQRLTDAADTETLLRIVQSVPSPKAEPIK